MMSAYDSSDLDLDLSNDASAQAQPAFEPVPVPVPTSASVDDDHTLDFDLGGLSFEPVTATDTAAAHDEAALDFSIPDRVTPEPAPAPAMAATADEDAFDMAFDMSFDTPAPVPAAEPIGSIDEITLDLANHDLPADFGTVDLSKEFDLPALPDTPTVAPASAAVDHPLMDLDAMDFDLPPATAAQPAAPAAPAFNAEADDDFFNLDLPDAAATQVSTPAAPGFDISSIDLDLPAEAATTFDNTPTALPDLDDLELPAPATEPEELSAVQMEMETKLDLAVAYQEIGDKEGARELLDEVIKGGSAEQVGRANDMRARLA
jgi:pilus assembly protein FimV